MVEASQAVSVGKLDVLGSVFSVPITKRDHILVSSELVSDELESIAS